MRFRFLAFVVSVILFSSSVGVAQEKYDPQHTMLALNMAIMSVNRIISAEDRVVLDHEYKNILNNLKIGEIAADEEIIDVYEGIMDLVTYEKLRSDESERLKELYDRKAKNGIYQSLSNIRAYGGSIWSVIGSFAVSATSSYFNYKALKDDYRAELDESLWQLHKNRVIELNNLNKGLLRSSWRLLRQYGLPDEHRITEELIDLYLKAENEGDRHRALAMFRRLEVYFQAYPPFWFDYGKAAQNAGEYDLALKCYDKFSEINRPVLRKDPFVVEVAKNRLALLNVMKMDKLEGRFLKGAERERCIKEIRACLKDIRDNSLPGEWTNNLVVGVQLSGLGDMQEAIETVRENLVWGAEVEYSSAVLRVLEMGLGASKLPDELRRSIVSIGKAEEPSLVVEGDLLKALSLFLDGQDSLALDGLDLLAREGNPVALDVMADMFEYGVGVQEDSQRAADLRDAIDLDYLNVLEWEKALSLLERRAEAGNVRAQFYLGRVFYNGFGVPEDISVAIEWLTKAAEQGHVIAQNRLGILFDRGEEVEENQEKAVYWYRNSAEGGYHWGQYNLGHHYYYGIGVEKDEAQAVFWFKKSANQGNSWSQDMLGDCYEYGRGVGKDLREAVMWYHKSAEGGYHWGELNLGNCYYNGDGVEKDYVQAIKWFYRAADKGNLRAKNMLGICYDSGYGVEQDSSLAAAWFIEAAEGGYSWGQYNLANCYLDGEGINKDVVEAYMWFYIASKSGDDSCVKKSLEAMEKMLGKGLFNSKVISDSQVQDAMRMANERMAQR